MTPSALEIMLELSTRGAKIRFADGQLWVKAPKGVITPELAAAITERKPELIAMLRTYPCLKCGLGIYHTPFVVCFKCRQKAQEADATSRNVPSGPITNANRRYSRG